MGPKTFVTCYVCSKEFGPNSIPFHEPKCLERWRTANKNLPSDKRASTPVKPADWKYSKENLWVCSHCQSRIPVSRRAEHSTICFKQLKSRSLSTNQSDKTAMTGGNKPEFSPKKGKENKNTTNRTPLHATKKKIVETGAKTDEKPKQEVLKSSSPKKTNSVHPEAKPMESPSDTGATTDNTESSSTSKRSIRPQTKILRRPTPNLKHPVIQGDSDDSSSDSIDNKNKEDNPKRFKAGNEASPLSTDHKPKNFIIYNKYNVEKNTKNLSKDRSSANASLPTTTIPNPCNSCSRNVAPERLHSHVKRDARGLMYRRSPEAKVPPASPQKKLEVTAKKIKEPQAPRAKSLESQAPEEVDDGEVGDRPPQPSFVPEPEKSCYICQEAFKVSLLLLHESECLEKWKKENNSLSPNLRKLPPRKPESEESVSINDPAWSAVQSQLVPCPLCRRTFFPERLPVHQRVCKGKQSPQTLKRASSLREHSASRSEHKDGEKPAAVYVTCYICGRNYGSWVIPMHETQCLRKWQQEKGNSTDNFQQESPKTQELSPEDDVTSLIELGDNAWENHLQQLVPCPRCSRTFFPDRLEIHERSCKGPISNRRPKSYKAG